MRYEYNFYITDESFDYGDFPGATVTETVKHGFSIEIDSDNKVDINSLESYGDYSQLQDEIKTLSQLKDYIVSHIEEIEEHDENEIITNYYLFIELTNFISEQLKEKEKMIKEEYKRKYSELIITGNIPTNPFYLYEYSLPADFEEPLYILNLDNENQILKFEICLNRKNELVLNCNQTPAIFCYKPKLENKERLPKC